LSFEKNIVAERRRELDLSIANETNEIELRPASLDRFDESRRSSIGPAHSRSSDERPKSAASVTTKGAARARARAAQKGTIAISRYRGTATCRELNISVMS